MNILIGAVSQHHVGPLMTRAMTHLPQENHFFGLAHAVGDDLALFNSINFPDHQQEYTAGLACVSLFANNSSPTLYRDRLIISLSGSIENSENILSKLQSLGYDHNLHSHEEMLAALIDWYDRKHKNLLQAMQLALKEVQGYFIVAALRRGDAATLVCASQGPSLYLGQGNDGSYFSSDPALIRERASLLIQLDAGEIAELTPQHVSCFGEDGQQCKKSPVPAHAAGHFLHHMHAEIDAQPRILAELITHFQHNTLASFLNQTGAEHPYQHILMLASGSSHHAASTARYWFEQMAGIPTQVEYGSEYRYRHNLVQANTLVIAISQSGETADTIAALKHAIALGHQHTLAISNNPLSTLAKLAQHQLMLHAGQEIGATSTKTFSTQLLCLYFVALKLASGKHIYPSQALSELPFLPRALAEVLKLAPHFKQWALNLCKNDNIFTIGRNLHFPIAMEAAQKLKEVCYVHAEGYPGGELKHGPVTLIDRHVPVLACLPWDLMAEKMLANLQEVRARQGQIYVLSDVALSNSDDFHCIQLPQKLALLNPILYTVAFQLLSYFTAISRGNNVDAPRNLSKTQDRE